jgi:L-histidine N-alpha-methyltransferase
MPMCLCAYASICSLQGLSAPTSEKFLHSTYFYDDLGSEIYGRITELPEYYPTKTELGILTDQRQRIAELFSDSQSGM